MFAQQGKTQDITAYITRHNIADIPPTFKHSKKKNTKVEHSKTITCPFKSLQILHTLFTNTIDHLLTPQSQFTNGFRSKNIHFYV